MTADKQVSIVIPLFNGAEWLARCLESVLRQTHRRLEIIIVDDGSVDDGVSVAESFRERDARIRLLYRDHRGVGPARNAGVDAATGEFIQFVDCDDTLEPKMTEILLQGIVASGCEWAVCSYAMRRPHENGFKEESLRLDLAGEWPAATQFMRFAEGDPEALGKFSNVWNKLYRAETIRRNRISFRDVACYEDLHFNLDFMTIAPNAWYIDQPLYTYHRHGRNSTFNFRPRGFEDNQWLYDLIRGVIGGKCDARRRSLLERHYIDKTIIIMRLLCRDCNPIGAKEKMEEIRRIVDDPQVRASLEMCADSGTQPNRLVELVRAREYTDLYEALRGGANPVTVAEA